MSRLFLLDSGLISLLMVAALCVWFIQVTYSFMFVNKLFVGDSILFVRAENGDICVGLDGISEGASMVKQHIFNKPFAKITSIHS